jgi:hypothetical protein
VQGSIASAAELGDGEAVLSQPLADGLTIFSDSRIKSGMKALDDEGSLRGVEFPSLVNEAHSDGFGWLWIPQLKVLDKGIQPSQVKHRQGRNLFKLGVLGRSFRFQSCLKLLTTAAAFEAYSSSSIEVASC